MRFVAIDVETSNPDMASICSIGAATFEDGTLSSEWYSLVNPDDYFDPMNVSIHGIDESDVAGAPTFADIANTLNRVVEESIVVTHTHFDRVAIHQAAHRWQSAPPQCTWLDSARVARRAWDECSRRGYGLANVCKLIGYDFQHHNALEDAKAAGQVLLAAMSKTGLNLEETLRRAGQPISPTAQGLQPKANPDGPLYGEVMVFTGALDIPRRAAAQTAAEMGCDVAGNVTAKTTILVVGDQDVTKLAGHTKSKKHREAERLIEQGQSIRIIRESDFRELASDR